MTVIQIKIIFLTFFTAKGSKLLLWVINVVYYITWCHMNTIPFWLYSLTHVCAHHSTMRPSLTHLWVTTTPLCPLIVLLYSLWALSTPLWPLPDLPVPPVSALHPTLPPPCPPTPPVSAHHLTIPDLPVPPVSVGELVWRQVLDVGPAGRIESLTVASGAATIVCGNPPLLRTFDINTAAVKQEITFGLPYKHE